MNLSPDLVPPFNKRHNGFSPLPSQLVSKLPIKKQEGVKHFKGISQDDRQAKIDENLRASPYNKELYQLIPFQPDPSRWTVPLISSGS